jgi:hypothetical protein
MSRALSPSSCSSRCVKNSHFYGAMTVRAHIHIRSYPQVRKSSNIPLRISAHLYHPSLRTTPPQILIGYWKDDGGGNGGSGEGHQETGSEVTSRAILKVDVTSFPLYHSYQQKKPPHLLRIPALAGSSVHTS